MMPAPSMLSSTCRVRVSWLPVNRRVFVRWIRRIWASSSSSSSTSISRKISCSSFFFERDHVTNCVNMHYVASLHPENARSTHSMKPIVKT